MSATKACTRCKEVKPHAMFGASSGAPDGLQYYCRACKTEDQRERRRRKRQARQDPAEHDYANDRVPDGYTIKGVSQYDPKTRKWVKTAADADRSRELMEEAVRAFCEPYRGSIDPVGLEHEPDEDLLTVIPIGDLHVGLRCYADEVGEDWDTNATERAFVGAVDGLLAVAPPARECLIVNVGDYLHADNSKGTTSKGTPLDTDGPRHRVLLLAVRMFRRAIDAALRKHERVTVICATGNHDGDSATWLRICLALAYEREPRVIIKTESSKFHWHRWGKCFFGVTHGDTCRVPDLPLIMATDRPEDWAASSHRVWITGHIHHDTVKELHGCTVRSYRTLAKGDRWHHGQGYRSGRDLRLEVWHREHGQVQEFIHSIGRIAHGLAG